MTREEKKQELIALFATGAMPIGELIDACFAFADANPNIDMVVELRKKDIGEVASIYEEWHNTRLQEMIDKACEWLDSELPKYVMGGREGKPYISVAMVDDFRKAMGGGE